MKVKDFPTYWGKEGCSPASDESPRQWTGKGGSLGDARQKLQGREESRAWLSSHQPSLMTHCPALVSPPVVAFTVSSPAHTVRPGVSGHPLIPEPQSQGCWTRISGAAVGAHLSMMSCLLTQGRMTSLGSPSASTPAQGSPTLM